MSDYLILLIVRDVSSQNRVRNCQTPSGSWSFVHIIWIVLTPPLNLVVRHGIKVFFFFLLVQGVSLRSDYLKNTYFVCVPLFGVFTILNSRKKLEESGENLVLWAQAYCSVLKEAIIWKKGKLFKCSEMQEYSTIFYKTQTKVKHKST